MVFSSPIFLFGFLPLVLFFYFLSPGKLKNSALLIFSLLFYSWGEVFYTGVMLVSIVSNYLAGMMIGKSYEKNDEISARSYLVLGVVINVGLLVSFKYANFITDNFNILLSMLTLSPIDLNPIHLPLGISFFTFQAISYIVDVYRKEVPYQKNILDLALFISLFPQLIAGPIIRYHDVALQIKSRSHSVELFASGVKRFVFGLAKKLLIANPMGEVADAVFDLSPEDIPLPIAWMGVVSYTLQIYFDFSGYSDMAIGLGRMFGFRFHENFNYPYISKNIREFWRRWHISLSTWFRDYVYIPLGGNRASTGRVYLNLLIVFFLTGFWHGASWNFIFWGMYHGFFIVLERLGLDRVLKKVGKPVQHLYLLGIVIIGWVFFRAENLQYGFGYLARMFNLSALQVTRYELAYYTSYEYVYALLAGILFSMPVYPFLRDQLRKIQGEKVQMIQITASLSRVIFISGLLFVCCSKIAATTYNPFIYFRF